MTFYIDSHANINSLFWISSLPEEQMGPTRRMVEDLRSILSRNNTHFSFSYVRNNYELYDILGRIVSLAVQNGIRPIIHLDMHGSEDGLYISESKTIAPWSEVVSILQSLNMATICNLILVAGVCYAYNLIRFIKLDEPCPVYMLIAPENKVFSGYLEDNVVNFYDDLFESSDIIESHGKNIAESMRLFHCEKFFAILIGKYISKYCMGKGKNKRKEGLLTELIWMGHASTPENLRFLRRKIESHIKPSQDIIDKKYKTFLCGRDVKIKIDDIINLI